MTYTYKFTVNIDHYVWRVFPLSYFYPLRSHVLLCNLFTVTIINIIGQNRNPHHAEYDMFFYVNGKFTFVWYRVNVDSNKQCDREATSKLIIFTHKWSRVSKYLFIVHNTIVTNKHVFFCKKIIDAIHLVLIYQLQSFEKMDVLIYLS